MEVKDYEICLSIQRALLDKITPNLRRISFIRKNKEILLYFFYDNLPSEIEEELAQDVSAEVIADFPIDYTINLKIIEIKFPKKIISEGKKTLSKKY